MEETGDECYVHCLAHVKATTFNEWHAKCLRWNTPWRQSTLFVMCLPYTLILLQGAVIYSDNNLGRGPCTIQPEGFRIQSSKNKLPEFPSTFFLESTLNSYVTYIKKQLRRKRRKISRIAPVRTQKKSQICQLSDNPHNNILSSATTYPSLQRSPCSGAPFQSRMLTLTSDSITPTV